MRVVEPIRDRVLLEEFKEYLKEWNERNYIMFMIGINTGLRITDILRLKVGDVKGSHIVIQEEKTDKWRKILVTKSLKKELQEYITGKKDHEYLIKSRQGHNQPITRDMAYKILRTVAEEFDMERVGTHSMRKTYGYWFYKKYKDAAVLQDLFGHFSQEETLTYIGINQDTHDKYMADFGL
ncbi:tyrosine-type recombinase/integrase [Brevibacillus brevis]|uniref:tyrosine-type recombinase/integrase n=1 Tax=Brevibacillus brevis TaxID=1393 RepID=UPI00115B287D|nr:tyrosine-type recombinase/integrase [Lysinibacillus sp. SDF0063]TQR29406.1 site-specific integrase [Lysinibacillus sp. SDF0063]